MASKKAAVDNASNAHVTIPAPNFKRAEFLIRGISPYMQHKFPKKVQEQMRAVQEAGSTNKSKKVREPKDFEQNFEDATYRHRDGWFGIPASVFRNAMISACRTVGFKMTLAKLGISVEADGLDEETGTPLVRIEGERKMDVSGVRNQTGVVDLRARPRWDEWSAVVRVEFDADMFTLEDVSNLMMRVGRQVGIGEGRPDSKKSAGIGFGRFVLEDKEAEEDGKSSTRHAG